MDFKKVFCAAAGLVGTVAVSLAIFSTPSHAQPRPDAGAILESTKQPAIAPKPGADVLPRVEEPRPALGAPGLKVTVKAFKISGNTLYPESVLLETVKEFVGKEQNIDGLNDAATKVRAYFRERGYFLAQAYLPQQEIKEGVVEIAVIEARVGKVALNFKGSHNLQNTKAIGFSQAWHTSNRVSRGRARGMASGRVGSKNKKHLGVVTLGPEGRSARAYMRLKQKMVGWARSGWGAAIWGLGGQLGANWMSRHGAQGKLIMGLTSPNPFIHVINDTSWAKYGGEGEGNRIIRNAISARARDMESYFYRMMKLAATKATGGPA